MPSSLPLRALPLGIISRENEDLAEKDFSTVLLALPPFFVPRGAFCSVNFLPNVIG